MVDEKLSGNDRVPTVEERVVQTDETAQVAIMGLMLDGVPRDLAKSVDALVVVPGLGETWRVTQTIQAWERHRQARYLLIAGSNGGEKTFVPLTFDNLKDHPFGLSKSKGVYSQIYAANTKVQADWIIGKVSELEITSLALFAPPYHLLRAYCTVLRAFERNGVPQIPMIPVPIVVSPDVLTPEYNKDAWEMATGEIKRILEYQKKGDVATFAELRKYLSQLWANPFLEPIAHG